MGRVIHDLRLTSRQVRRHDAPGRTPSSNVARATHLSRDQPDASAGRVGRLLPHLALALPILAIFLWVWSLGTERRAIHDLPAAQRAAVYADTMRTFAAMCVPPRTGLEKHCRSQAGFLVNFADCDQHCRDLTAPLLRWRTP